MDRKYKIMEDIGFWIEENIPELELYSEITNAIYWFVALNQAKNLGELTTKDLASLFLNGVKPIDRDDVNEYLNNYYEDYGDDANEMITSELTLHFKSKGK